MRDHRIQAQYSNDPKSLLGYICSTVLLGGPCIYGTHVVPPRRRGVNTIKYTNLLDQDQCEWKHL